MSVISDCWKYAKKANGFGWNIENLVNEFGLKELKQGPALAYPEVSIDL